MDEKTKPSEVHIVTIVTYISYEDKDSFDWTNDDTKLLKEDGVAT
jgi:hypothetical protein